MQAQPPLPPHGSFSAPKSLSQWRSSSPPAPQPSRGGSRPGRPSAPAWRKPCCTSAGGIGMQSQGLQVAGAPATGADPSASSGQANQQAALLQILTLAKLAAQLPAPQPQIFAPPAAAPAAFAPPQQLGAPPPGAEASGTSSDRIALPLADATAELEAAPSVAGLKVRTLPAVPAHVLATRGQWLNPLALLILPHMPPIPVKCSCP